MKSAKASSVNLLIERSVQPKYFEAFELDARSIATVPVSDGLLPIDYLRYAILDLEEGSTERHLINSVSNAKKALHLQVSVVVGALGMPISKNEPFPKMLDFCRACGVVGSRVLKKLNRLRNTVEHEYVVPSQEAAENFADVVELFLFGTQGLLNFFPSDISLCAPDMYGSAICDLGIITEKLDVDWEPGSGQISLKADFLTISADEICSLFAGLAEPNSQWATEGEATADNQGAENSLRTVYIRALEPYRRSEEQLINIRDRDNYYAWSNFLLHKAQLTIT
jgi:hypothetical protein